MFRGRRRFVVCVGRSLILERVQGEGGPVHASTSSKEIATLAILKQSTVRSRARARKILEDSMPSWTTITWDGDKPIYVHKGRR